MYEVIVLAVFGLLSAILAFLLRNFGKMKQKTKSAEGIVNHVVHTQGVIYYAVAFSAGGESIIGESIPYSSRSKRLRTGDRIGINYYCTNAGKPRVIILDPELEACAKSAHLIPRALRWVSAGFFLAAAIMLIRCFL